MAVTVKCAFFLLLPVCGARFLCVCVRARACVCVRACLTHARTHAHSLARNGNYDDARTHGLILPTKKLLVRR